MSITKDILKTISLGEDLLVEINNLRYLPYEFMWGTSLQGYDRKIVQSVLSHAVKRGFVSRIRRKEKVFLALTDLGTAFLDKKQVSNQSLKLDVSKGKWDGLYRFVFFDIPEKDRVVRDTLRNALKQVGGVGLQKSVWVTKENITRPLNAFIQENQLENYLMIVEVKEIYNPRLKMLLEKF